MGHGLQNALTQALNYARTQELHKCDKIMLTDGLRIYLFQKDNDSWMEKPSGYFNVEKIRTNHIAPSGTDAIDILVALTPSGVVRDIGM